MDAKLLPLLKNCRRLLDFLDDRAIATYKADRTKGKPPLPDIQGVRWRISRAITLAEWDEQEKTTFEATQKVVEIPGSNPRQYRPGAWRFYINGQEVPEKEYHRRLEVFVEALKKES
jgi:hypothetical protein